MEKELLSKLYRMYQKEIYLYLYSLCQNTALAEDLTQETFLKALLSLNEQHTNMRAWLYLVARNLYYNHWKKEKSHVPLDEMKEQDNGMQAMSERMIADERRRCLYHALENLEQKKREVLLLQYFGGLSQREIAAVLHMTPENVRVLAYRAKREVKSYMEVQGYDIP